MSNVFYVSLLMSVIAANVAQAMEQDNNQRICLSMEHVVGLVPEHPELKLEEEYCCYRDDIETDRSSQDSDAFDNPRSQWGTVIHYKPFSSKKIADAIRQYEKDYVQYLKDFKAFVSFLKMLDQNNDVSEIKPLEPTGQFIPKIKTVETQDCYFVDYFEEQKNNEWLKRGEKHREIYEKLFDLYETVIKELASQR